MKFSDSLLQNAGASPFVRNQKGETLCAFSPKIGQIQEKTNHDRMQSRHRSKVLKQHFETCALMALRQFALFLVYEIVEISSREQERTWTSSLLPASPSAINTKKRREVECIYLPEALDCPQRINTNNSRPKRPSCLLAV